MATRKAICLVSGLFEEVNTPTDKLDFAGNSTTDLAEGTNLYYTTTQQVLLPTLAHLPAKFGLISLPPTVGLGLAVWHTITAPEFLPTVLLRPQTFVSRFPSRIPAAQGH